MDDALVEPDQTFQVTLLSGLLGAPTQALVAIRDNDSAAPQASIDSPTVFESVGNATPHLRLSHAYNLPVEIGYATADGTATASATDPAVPDYTETQGTPMAFGTLVVKGKVVFRAPRRCRLEPRRGGMR